MKEFIVNGKPRLQLDSDEVASLLPENEANIKLGRIDATEAERQAADNLLQHNIELLLQQLKHALTPREYAVKLGRTADTTAAEIEAVEEKIRRLGEEYAEKARRTSKVTPKSAPAKGSSESAADILEHMRRRNRNRRG